MRHGLTPQIGQRSERIEKEKAVYLFLSYKDCETALYQWLGEEFDEIIPYTEAITLQIKLPDDFPLIRTCEWEYVSKNKINPSCISFFKYEG